MEENTHTVTTYSQPQAADTLEVKSPKRKFGPLVFILAGILFVSVIVLGGYLFLNQSKDTNEKTPASAPSVTQQSADAFFFYSVPRPLENLTIFSLPNFHNPYRVIKIGDSLWMTSEGSIIEYSLGEKKILSYTNALKANCDGELVYAANFLYAACRVDNVDDAFDEVRMLDTKIYTGRYGVYKIDPAKHTVERVFTRADGLLNNFNYRLYSDGNFLWIATFNGVGKIDLVSNKVEFYTTEKLGFDQASSAEKTSINSLLIDKEYIWATHGGSSVSQGGLAVYDKATGIWKAFGPSVIKDEDKTRFDVDFSNGGYAIKLVAGGIQVGFRDGKIGEHDKFVEKQYLYSSGTWVKVNEDRVATGPESLKTNDYITESYPIESNFSLVEQDTFTQIRLKDSTEVLQLNGRANLIISPVISNKRYTLTTSTIDVIDDESPLPRVLVKLGSKIEEGIIASNLAYYEGIVNFLVDPTTLFAVATDSDCGGMGCTGKHKVWLIDLKNAKLAKIFTKEDGIEGEMLSKLTMRREGDNLVMSDNEGDVFSINTATNKIQILKTEKQTGLQ